MIYGRGDGKKNPTVSSRENGPPVLLESSAGRAREGDGQGFTVQQFCANTLWSDGVLFLLDLQTRVASTVPFVVQTAVKPDLPLVVFGGSLKTASEGPAGRWVEPVTNPRERHRHLGVLLEDESQVGLWRFLCVQRGISLLSRNANNSNTTASLTPLNMLAWYNNVLTSFTLWTYLAYPSVKEPREREFGKRRQNLERNWVNLWSVCYQRNQREASYWCKGHPWSPRS